MVANVDALEDESLNLGRHPGPRAFAGVTGVKKPAARGEVRQAVIE
jgi:hypothetical protein